MENPVIETPLPSEPSAGKTNVLSIISLVTGILGLLASCVGLIPVVGWFSLICVAPLGLAGIITGIIGLTQTKKTGQKGKGMAIAGLVLGILGMVFVCLVQLGMTALAPVIGNIFSGINSGLGY